MPTHSDRITSPAVAGGLGALSSLKLGSDSTSPPRSNYSPGRRSSQSLLRVSGPAATKLEHVAERFSAFYNDLEQEKQQRRVQDTTKFQQLSEAVIKVEKGLEAEIKRRAESDKQLQSHFEGEIKSMSDRLTMQMGELQHAVKTSLDGLSRSLADLHIVIKEEREQRRSDIEHLAQSLVNKVNECVTAMDDERLARIEAEAKVLKQVGQDMYKVQERIETEKALREAELAQLRGEIHEVLGNRNMTDEKFQAVVLDELAALKQGLALEREERVAEDDEIVQAVNDYTRALQDGLRLVNTT